MELIDRQAAIDALDEIQCEVDDGDGFQYEKWLKYFCELPSAQPEPCEDAVSREAAIDVFYELWGTSLTRTVNAIKELPSVTPKQRWIPVEEALPEEYGEYFVTWWCEHLKRPFVEILEYEPSYIFDHEKNRFTGEWLYPKDDERFTDGIVIAWKQLEEPYKGKE